MHIFVSNLLPSTRGQLDRCRTGGNYVLVFALWLNGFFLWRSRTTQFV